MKREYTSIDDLKEISIIFPGDFYQLAHFILLVDIAESTELHTSRHTIHGVANIYCMITKMDLNSVEETLYKAGFTSNQVIDR